MKRIIIIAAVLGLVLTTVTASSAHQRTDRNWAAVQVPIDVDGIRDVVPWTVISAIGTTYRLSSG